MGDSGSVREDVGGGGLSVRRRVDGWRSCGLFELKMCHVGEFLDRGGIDFVGRLSSFFRGMFCQFNLMGKGFPVKMFSSQRFS